MIGISAASVVATASGTPEYRTICSNKTIDGDVVFDLTAKKIKTNNGQGNN